MKPTPVVSAHQSEAGKVRRSVSHSIPVGSVSPSRRTLRRLDVRNTTCDCVITATIVATLAVSNPIEPPRGTWTISVSSMAPLVATAMPASTQSDRNTSRITQGEHAECRGGEGAEILLQVATDHLHGERRPGHANLEFRSAALGDQGFEGRNHAAARAQLVERQEMGGVAALPEQEPAPDRALSRVFEVARPVGDALHALDPGHRAKRLGELLDRHAIGLAADVLGGDGQHQQLVATRKALGDPGALGQGRVVLGEEEGRADPGRQVHHLREQQNQPDHDGERKQEPETQPGVRAHSGTSFCSGCSGAKLGMSEVRTGYWERRVAPTVIPGDPLELLGAAEWPDAPQSMGRVIRINGLRGRAKKR